MNIDYVLLKSAGFGTRMGKIGTQLPKVLWPIFEKSLLELQVAYWRQYRPKIIFINVHFHAEFIIRTIKSRVPNLEDIVFLPEPTLLDSGGPIYSVKQHLESKGHDGTTLVVANSDQLLFNICFDAFPVTDVTLLAVEVDPQSTYNRLLTKNGFLEKLAPPSPDAPNITFAGISYFNLNNCDGKAEPIKFFDGPANFHKKKVQVEMLNCPEVWDFGTKEYYFSSLKKIFNSLVFAGKEEIIAFLTAQHAIDENKLNKQALSYGISKGYKSGAYVFNFSGEMQDINNSANDLALLAPGTFPHCPQSRKLYYHEIEDEIEMPST